ncbi:acetyl-CoA carboxylase biotin carboxylase subunit [Actinomadura soli]|uniref:biotin carboxylase n=1 Tax=Actinomadura soli TaxID=2508997 RepID=A0A5C4JEA3_9ACTN|nr:acetyl-CoA carboxylase biotin carboxylase subunit [Actinomadura soli]TMR02607.1 acetyl-CoA carboxylase biotin carboxylase subunit [Actinomadura soli]
MFGTVLIANRGEIALRVARTCRELGVRTVAVYSTEDRDSPVVSYADQAVHIGPGPAKRSYLNIPAVIEAARQTGADAVHPGYGFLSEDPDFAEVCGKEGLTFIGPPAEVMARLGDKCTARRTMAETGLPLLPGSFGPVASAQAAREAAERIGFPVIIKAAAGGGGRGMRVVDNLDSVLPVYAEVSGEAQTLFGDSTLYVERYLPSARHVEVQVLCDGHGEAVHLGVRDCSVQRRHQKLLEESPAPCLPPGTIDRMGEAAVAGALAAGYTGAGTFEFLVDADAEFYFMEVNCRIQVEHPVTELVTGLDLVREQLRVAAGERLGLRQDDVRARGAAIECRVNVEDPDRGFVPTPGRIETLELPGGPFVRVDTHGYPGYRVPALYDPLLAKVLAWAPTREQAVARMDRALAEFRAEGPGVRTTAGFLRRVLADERFRAGTYDTGLVSRLMDAPGTADAGPPTTTQPEEERA